MDNVIEGNVSIADMFDKGYSAKRISKCISSEIKNKSYELKTQGNPNFHNESQRLANIKYGQGWREKLDRLAENEWQIKNNI